MCKLKNLLLLFLVVLIASGNVWAQKKTKKGDGSWYGGAYEVSADATLAPKKYTY